MITKEKIKEILSSKGITLEGIVKNTQLLEKACNTAYKTIPIPLRWFVGKKRIKGLILSLAENISARIDTKMKAPASEIAKKAGEIKKQSPANTHVAMPAVDDIKPINGPAKYSFSFADLSEVKLPGWPPPEHNPHQWSAAKTEFNRHWGTVKEKRIWSPYPILSYCLGTASAPVPDEHLTPTQRIARSVINERDGGEKVSVCYFVFPARAPEAQFQAIAQVVCETKPGAAPGDVRMWVDALGEEELEPEHHRDMKIAAGQI